MFFMDFCCCSYGRDDADGLSPDPPWNFFEKQFDKER